MRWTSFLLLCALSWPATAQADKMQLEGVVNLNTASGDELRLIPGIGPARVRNILAYRRQHPFRTVDDLARINGIGRKTVRQWRKHLAVSGPSTAQRVVRPELPFVGPPAAPTAPVAKPPPAPPARMARPGIRRGEPAHQFFPTPAGSACLPPP